MEVKRGYKQTEVGVIPEDWGVARLGELLEITSSKRVFQSEWKTVGVPFYRARELAVLSETGVVDNDLFISKQMYNAFRQAHGVPQVGDLLVTGVGTLGKVYVVPDDCEFYFKDGNIIWFKIAGAICPSYLRQLYLTPVVVKQIADSAAGTTVGTYTISGAKKTVIPLPTRIEQEAIAEALSDADALIESLEQLLVKKRHLKQGAMQELLTGKKRLPGFSGEWEMKRLGALASIQRGASPRPIDSPVWFDENSSVGWVRISDVTKAGMYLLETTQRLSPLGVQHSRPVSRGSMIMSICATVGRPIITEIDTCIHDGFVVFDNLRVDKQFLYYILKSIEGDWSRHGQTGSQMNLNTGLINRTEVFVPQDISEQTAIAAILSDMDAELAALETKLVKARRVKQGMMQELLTGRIRLV